MDAKLTVFEGSVLLIGLHVKEVGLRLLLILSLRIIERHRIAAVILLHIIFKAILILSLLASVLLEPVSSSWRVAHDLVKLAHD